PPAPAPPTPPCPPPGPTAPDATGPSPTLITAPPACPPLTAVTAAAPGAPPVTSPGSFTVATPAWLLDQVTARLLSTFPPASLSVAPSCTVCPTVTLAAPGVTVTDATGTFTTVIAAVAPCPSLVAVIAAAPGPPESTPLHDPLPIHRRHPRLAARPGHRPAAQHVPAGVLGRRRELHRLPHKHRRHRRAHLHRRHRHVHHGDRGTPRLSLAQRRDRRRPR